MVSLLMGTMPPRALLASGVASFSSTLNGFALQIERTTSMNAISNGFARSAFPIATRRFLVTGKVTFIYYNLVIDGRKIRHALDTCDHVPAIKSLYLRWPGKKRSFADDILPRSVSARLKIGEINEVGDLQARKISGVDKLKNYVLPGSPSVPYLDPLTQSSAVPMFLGKICLMRYGIHDIVPSVYTEFLRADPENAQDDDEHKAFRPKNSLCERWILLFFFSFHNCPLYETPFVRAMGKTIKLTSICLNAMVL